MSMLTFWILAALAVGSAAGLVLKRNPIHGALFLVINLASVAALFLTMRAEFLALAQVLVYAGAIAVLFVFAIMVLIPGKEETGADPLRAQRWMAVPLAGVLLLLTGLMVQSVSQGGRAPSVPVDGSAESMGRLLFTDYVFPFEVTSILLLAAIVGVIALTKRRVP